MRALAIVAAAAGFAVSVPTLASAAELEVPQDRCALRRDNHGEKLPSCSIPSAPSPSSASCRS